MKTKDLFTNIADLQQRFVLQKEKEVLRDGKRQMEVVIFDHLTGLTRQIPDTVPDFVSYLLEAFVIGADQEKETALRKYHVDMCNAMQSFWKTRTQWKSVYLQKKTESEIDTGDSFAFGSKFGGKESDLIKPLLNRFENDCWELRDRINDFFRLQSKETSFYFFNLSPRGTEISWVLTSGNPNFNAKARADFELFLKLAIREGGRFRLKGRDEGRKLTVQYSFEIDKP